MAGRDKILMVKNITLLFWIISGCLLAKPIVSGDLANDKFNLVQGNLADVILTQLPLCDAALVIGKDGTAVLIPAYAFEKIQVEEFEGIWNLKSEELPPVTNIRDFTEICLQQIPAQYSIKILGEDNRQLSPFQYKLEYFNFLGESEKNGYSMKKYKFSNEINEIKYDNVDKFEFTSGEIKNIMSNNSAITFENFYFKAADDTLKTIYLK